MSLVDLVEFDRLAFFAMFFLVALLPHVLARGYPLMKSAREAAAAKFRLGYVARRMAELPSGVSGQRVRRAS